MKSHIMIFANFFNTPFDRTHSERFIFLLAISE